MSKLIIHYFVEDVAFRLKDKRKLTALIRWVNENHRQLSGHINYIFCSDEYLLGINQDFLDHHDFTDIITFEDYDPDGELMSDIYISLDRIKENAIQFNVTPQQELIRVVSHGILHISGYKDKSKKERALMQEKENDCITKYFNDLA